MKKRFGDSDGCDLLTKNNIKIVLQFGEKCGITIDELYKL